jgi:hypothetical protein
MKTAIRSTFSCLTGAALSVLTAAGMDLTFSEPVVAQQSNAASLQETSLSGDGRTSDPFSGSGSSQINSVMDLIQRAMYAPTYSDEDFRQRQQETFGTEASDFRARQLELLRQENQTQGSLQNPTPPIAPR